MKLLHIFPSFGMGGMEKVICTVINHTCSKYQHSILSLDGDHRALQWIQTEKVQVLPFHKVMHLSSFSIQLYHEIKHSAPDLLMTYNWGGTDAIWIGKMAGVKHIIHHEHGFSIEESRNT